MTPEAVIYRYLQLAADKTAEDDALHQLICADADLLNNWLRLFDLPADLAALTTAFAELSPTEFASLAPAQVSTASPLGATARLGIEQWLSVARAAFLAQMLAEHLQEIGARDIDTPQDVRLRALLALSGVNLDNDEALGELIEYRGTPPHLLEDAGTELKIFAVVDAVELERDSQLAGELLGIDADRYAGLKEFAAQAVDRLIIDTALETSSDVDWSRRVWLRQQIAVVGRAFANCTTEAEFLAAHELVSRGLFTQAPLLLLYDAVSDTFALQGNEKIGISGQSRTSGIALAHRDAEIRTLADNSEHAVVDRQLLKLLGVDDALAVPVGQGRDSASKQHLRGVLVVAKDDDVDIDVVAEIYAEEFNKYLNEVPDPEMPAEILSLATELEAIPSEALVDFRTQEIQRLRELVHEANNPLSIVSNYLHILGMQLQHEPEAVEKLNMISAELRRAEEVFARAREVPDIDETVDTDGEPADPIAQTDGRLALNPWIYQVAELHRGLANERGVNIEASGADGEITVRCDSNRLAQIVTNLLKNAVEACSTGDRVVLGLEANVYRNGVRGVNVVVQDNGPGLPESVLRQLREDKESTKGGEGVGLKLAYQLTEEIGGALDVSASAKGTEFTLFLPLESH